MRYVIFILLLSMLLIGCTTDIPLSTAVMTDIAQTETDATMTPSPSMNASDTPAAFPVESENANRLSPTPEPTVAPLPGVNLFTFAGKEPGWYTVDDDVMGGVSSSTVSIIEPSLLSFSGNMSLENNGGFSSVRSDWSPTNLSNADGVLLKVLGDGNQYRLRIRTASAGRGVSYNALFQTQPETWSYVYVPFKDMVPTYRGFLMDVGELDTSSIGSFGFMLSDKQPGEFNLLVDWIRAVSEKEIRPSSSPDSVAMNHS
jgi:hypothetical protein